MKTPVVFIIFNRPEVTAKVFAAIQQAKPPQLLIIADGPRQDRLGEREKCDATRKIIEKVDWPCEVIKNYSEINLGCKARISSGMNWVFENVSKAIILEDDCLPDLSFFPYCEELLERYEEDHRIMTVCGVNFQRKRYPLNHSYYYSSFHDCWGWATWRRAWQYYDYDMKNWPAIKETDFLLKKLGSPRAAKYWTQCFDSAYDGSINTWFYRWLLSCWLEGGLGIFPQVNLISNIGFGETATHTRNDNMFYANMKTESLHFPLQHPLYILPDVNADRFTQANRFDPDLKMRGLSKIKRIIRKLTNQFK